MPVLADQRLELEALDQDPALLVQAEVHRSQHLLAAARSQPRFGDTEQRPQDLRVVLELEEAEHPRARAVEPVVGEVDLGGDPADHAAVAPGQEVLRFAVLEVGVQLAIEEEAALDLERRDPGGPDVQAERQVDEFADLAASLHGGDLDRHGGKAICGSAR